MVELICFKFPNENRSKRKSYAWETISPRPVSKEALRQGRLCSNNMSAERENSLPATTVQEDRITVSRIDQISICR